MKKRIISIMALALVMTGCSFNLPGQEAETDESLESLLEEDADSSEAIDTSANIDTKSSTDSASKEDSKAATSDSSKAEESDSNVSKKPSGTYSRSFTEEIGGEDVTVTYSYTFKEDGTGTADIQDVVPMTWDDTKITVGDVSFEYKYNAETDTISVKGDSGWEEFLQK